MRDYFISFSGGAVLPLTQSLGSHCVACHNLLGHSWLVRSGLSADQLVSAMRSRFPQQAVAVVEISDLAFHAGA